MNGVKRFGMKGKLAPRYIGPFPILEKCGTVAYKLELPPSLTGVYDIFHISQLKKCLKTPVDIVLREVTLLEMDLTYPEHLIKILDQKSHVRRRKTIKFYKCNGVIILKKKQHGSDVTSSIHDIWILCYRSEGTCDCSLSLCRTFLLSNLGSRFLFRGEGCDTHSFIVAATIFLQYLTMYLQCFYGI
jgi:hypothetical protein